jgi:hypothetical protein
MPHVVAPGVYVDVLGKRRDYLNALAVRAKKNIPDLD